MAVPAALAQINSATVLLHRRIVGGFGMHPFELTEVGAHHRGHLVRQSGRLEQWQQSLGEDSGKEGADAGHSATNRRVIIPQLLCEDGSGLRSGTDLLAARVCSDVMIKLTTRSVMPMSMVDPASVRANQNGRTGRIESIAFRAGHPFGNPASARRP